MESRTVEITVQRKEVQLNCNNIQYTFKLTKGWKYLLELFRHPGEERSAASFISSEAVIDTKYNSMREISNAEREYIGLYTCDYLPPVALADHQTIREVSHRLNQVVQMEASARSANNYAHLDDLLEEKEMLMQYLSEVLKTQGKLRFSKDNGIQAVNQAIRKTLILIEDTVPIFGKDLRKRVRNWQKVCYEPGEWEVRV